MPTQTPKETVKELSGKLEEIIDKLYGVSEGIYKLTPDEAGAMSETLKDVDAVLVDFLAALITK